MKKFTLIFILVYILSGLDSLSSKIYEAIDTANFKERITVSKSFLKNHKKIVKTIRSEFKKDNSDCIFSKIKSAGEDIRTGIVAGDYIFHDDFSQLLSQSYERISKSNQAVINNPVFLVSRDISLNASCLINNTIIANLGTFYYLDNESQLIAVLAHELAHFQLKHHIISLKQACLSETEKAKNSLESIKRSRYGRGSKALENYKNILYDLKRIDRAQEFEADSLGFIIYKKTGLNPASYLQAFKLMLEFDTIKPSYLDSAVYRKVFNLPELPFRNSWLKMEDFSSYDYSVLKDKFHKDSVLGHPRLQERIDRLTLHFPELKMQENTDTASTSFSKISKIAGFERFTSLDLSEEYGFGVYLCLLNLSRDKVRDPEFYEYWLGKYMDKIYKARKSYTLNRHLDRVDPKNQPHDYQQFLNFMWNLNIAEMDKISKHYLNKTKTNS